MHYEWRINPDGSSSHVQVTAPTPVPAVAPTIETPTAEPEKNPVFACEVCGKTFRTKLALTGHTRGHKWR